MNYTNKMNYPNYVVEWLKYDNYDYEPGVLSATRLIQPIRKTLLEERHAHELESDVADNIPKRYGTALHDSFEAMDFGPDVKQEIRYWATINIDTLEQEISGKFDMLVREPNGFRLVDLKSTSAWSFIFGSRDDDHRKQMSILRFILDFNDIYVIDVSHIVYLFTDWKRSDAKRNPQYPEQRILVKPLELWSVEKTQEWITKRIVEIDTCRNLPDDSLPECPDDELWRREEKFAVMKVGRKSAVKLYDNREDAVAHTKSLSSQHYMDHRIGKVQRCGYCNAPPFCNQYEAMKRSGDVD